MVRPQSELEPLQKQFVCVRLAQMNGLDLGLFQFDYDQTLVALFLNADGTVYGRWGTRAGNGPNSTTHISLASFRRAMERALALHQGYPANRAALAGKRGPAPEYPTANRLPGLEDRPLRVTANKGCIHCHQAREAPLRFRWQNRRLTAKDLWVYPLPENAGIKLEVDDGLRVAAVTPGSPAARAGLRPGDDLRTLEGQPLLSQADVQWVLNRAPETATLKAEYVREGQPRSATLALAGEWKKTDLTWRPSSGPALRSGLWSTPLPDAEKAKRGLPAGSLALEVKNLFLPRAQPVKEAGVRVGDVILAADGRADFANEGEFLAFIRLAHGPGEKVRLTLLRGTEKLDLHVPMW